MTSVHIAITPEERRKVFELRYRIYIKQQGKSYIADHENRLFYDEADDEESVLLYTMDVKKGGVVSTLRGNWTYKHCVSNGFMRLQLFQTYFGADRVVFASRLMALPTARSQVTKLFEMAYRIARGRGVVLCFAHSTRELMPLFQKLGFRAYAEPYNMNGVGVQQPMCMLLDDVTHYSRVRSPLLALAQQYGCDESNKILFERCLHAMNQRDEKTDEVV